MTWGRRMAFALRYLTRVRLPGKTHIRSGEIARSCMLFPIVGALEGTFVFLIAKLGMSIAYGYYVALFALAARALIGRGKVRDAAHTLDGLGSSRDRVRTIQIMFDDSYGTMGVLTFIFDFLLKGVLYWEIFQNMSFDSGILLIISSCIAGKLSMVAGAVTSNSVFGNDRLIDQSRYSDLIIAAIIVFAFEFFLLGWQTAILLVVMEISIGLIISGIIVMRLGGLTKQTLGLVVELGEIMVLYLLLVW